MSHSELTGRPCANRGSTDLLTGHDVLGFDLPPVRDPLPNRFYEFVHPVSRALRKWLKERERPRPWLLALAITAAPLFVYYHVWGMAAACWGGSLIGVHHERDEAFKDSLFCGTRTGIVLTNLACMVFCRRCGYVQAPHFEVAVEANAESVERFAERATFEYLRADLRLSAERSGYPIRRF